MFPLPIEKLPRINQYRYRLFLYLSVILWLLPLIAIMLVSLRSLSDLNAGNYWGIPTELNLFENYSEVFVRSPMATYFLNSLIITIPTTIITLIISSMSGFTLAIHKFKFNMFIFAMFIAGNFIPFQILLVPVRSITIQFGMYDTWYALIIFHVAFQSGFCTFFLRNFIKELPFELIEAARVDGATEVYIYTKIIIPLMRPALAALGVLIFTFIWNDYFWALVLVQSDSVRPVTVGLQALRGQWVASWNLIAAGSIVCALPPVIMFFILQKQFIRGLTFGAVKG
ncbi:carbohydrate ABC transporter permease [Pelagibacteraceae bacterium]|nr:carbohydrate ABC transporter permease [Pelagibacteraceae bacterium]MDC3156169.1 carbohydrate ABC transporter permease [Pelagibacteraceae bacterium]